MKRLIALALCATMMLCGAPIAVFAADVDDMTLDEWKEAYRALAAENEDLKDQIVNLKAQLFDQSQPEPTEQATPTVEPTPESVHMTTEEFVEDVTKSYNERGTVAERYTNAQLNTMTDKELIYYHNECVEAERWLYEKYHYAVFDDLNIQYLCSEYIKGLEKQFSSLAIWEDTQDVVKANAEFNSGYYNRAYVIVELSDYYQASFDDIEGMRFDTAAMDSLNEAETRNASVDYETVQQTQELLNGIGFFCGAADGISGKLTVKSIKRFQEMYGYDIDGIIDDELISQLQAVLDEKR